MCMQGCRMQPDAAWHGMNAHGPRYSLMYGTRTHVQIPFSAYAPPPPVNHVDRAWLARAWPVCGVMLQPRDRTTPVLPHAKKSRSEGYCLTVPRNHMEPRPKSMAPRGDTICDGTVRLRPFFSAARTSARRGRRTQAKLRLCGLTRTASPTRDSGQETRIETTDADRVRRSVLEQSASPHTCTRRQNGTSEPDCRGTCVLRIQGHRRLALSLF